VKAQHQLPLDLVHRPALGREDFLVAPSNQLAVAWIDRWPDWPGPALALYGPAGCGKSHLGQVWRAASGAIEIDAAALIDQPPPKLLGSAHAVLMEGVEDALASGQAPERELLHLYNMVVERGGRMLITGRRAPARWDCRLADLGSRLGALQSVALGAPDDALIEAVLVKLFADRQLTVTPEVITYLVRRMERSFEAARRLVAAIDRAALAARRPITVPLVSEILAAPASRGDVQQ
jgi:chromosomal replication initiation ATPase DnaA